MLQLWWNDMELCMYNDFIVNTVHDESPKKRGTLIWCSSVAKDHEFTPQKVQIPRLPAQPAQ